MENPGKNHTEFTIQADIPEKYIEEHLSSAAKVANHTGKTYEITRLRDGDGIKPIKILIKPDDSAADVIKNYHEEVKQSALIKSEKLEISSPERIHQQDI